MAKNFEIKTTFRAVDKTSRVLGKMHTRIARFSARASKSLKKINQVAGRVTGALGNGLKIGAMAAAAAVTGLFIAVGKIADSMDALAKKTRAMQFPIEEFQEWRFVAEQSGVSSDVFDKSLGKFTKTVGELKGGYGAMYTALKKTNKPLLKQLQNTEDVDKAFEIYLSAIGNTPGAMNKAALATAGFGRAGADMINMANLGAEEISKLRGQMRENGVVTAEQAAQAEAYNDMMNRVKLTITGLMVNVFAPLMPMLTEIADKFRAWAVENKGLVSAKFKEYVKWIIDNIPTIVKWAKRAGIAVGIFMAIAGALKVVAAVLTIVNLLAAANPIGLIILAVMAAIAVIAYFWDDIVAANKMVYDVIKSVAIAIKDFFVGIWDWIIGKMEAQVELIKSIISVIVDFFQPAIDAFAAGWEYVGQVFHDVWQGIKDFGASIIDWIMKKIGLITSGFGAVADFLGFGDDEGGGMAAAAGGGSSGSVVSPIRPSVNISQSSSESVEKSEVTIKDETGRAKQTKGKNGRGFKLVHSGAMP